MGRKTKRKIHSHYSRTYQFRPRNGLGLYYPRANTMSTSSIFHYNQRDTSPDCSLENDEDLVQGILFTSYKDLRGLESHSPLTICPNSFGDKRDGTSIKICEVIDSDDHLRSHALTNSISTEYIANPCLDKFKSNIQKTIPSLAKTHQIYQPLPVGDLSGPKKSRSKKSRSSISKSPDIHVADISKLCTKPITESRPKNCNFINKSHPFLIENLLRQNTFESDNSSLNHTCHLNVPYGVSFHEHIRNDFEYSTLLSPQAEINFDDHSVTSIKKSKNSTFSRYVSVLPESKNVSHSSLIDPALKIKSTCSNEFSYEANVLSNYVSTLDTSPSSRFESLPFHKDNTSLYSSAQNSKVNFSPYFGKIPHKYFSNFGNIGSLDTVTKLNHISASLLPPQKKNYKICMNHANIAWSIYARETHLREEESREKGLYPLSLHNKNCFNRSILRPKAFRDLDSINRSRETELHYRRALSPFSQPCTIFRSDFPKLSGIDCNFLQNDHYSSLYNMNPLHLKLSSINQSSDQSSNSLEVSSCTENLQNLNYITQFHNPFNLVSNIGNNDRYPINRTPISNLYSNQLSYPDMEISEYKPIDCTNFSKILNPLIPSNMLFSSSKASHCQVTNLPIFALHNFEPSYPNII